MTPDVNVLVAAFRPDHPHHTVARLWLDDALAHAANGRTNLTLLGQVVTGFLRVASNPRIFRVTDPLQDLMDFVDSLLSYQGVQFQPNGATWPKLRQVCLAQQISGNLITDAWIAATVMQSGETLCTFDRDFARLLPSERLHILSR